MGDPARTGTVGHAAVGLLALLLLVCAGGAVPGALHAQAQQPEQETVIEEQVPVDSVRAIEEIDPQLRDQLGLFSDVDGFEVARLFRLSDGRTVLEIVYREEGRLLRERRYLPPEVLESLRNHLAERVAETGATPDTTGARRAQEGEEVPAPVEEDAAPDTVADREGAVAAADDETDAGTPEEAPAEDEPAPPPTADEEDRTAAEEGAGETDVEIPQDARGRLVLSQTALGLGFYGWSIPRALELDGERPLVATYLLTAGASFYLPYRLTKNRPVRRVHERMTSWGGTRGILYGLLGAEAVTGRVEHDDPAHLASAILTSMAGSFLGYQSVGWSGLDDGTAALWTTMADLGTLAGAGAAYSAGFYDEQVGEELPDGGDGDDPWWSGFLRDEDRPAPTGPRQARPRVADLTVLGMAGAGLLAGSWLGNEQSYTVGEAYGLRSAALLGAQIGLPVAELTMEEGHDRNRRYAAGAVLGGVAGTAVGSRLLGGTSLSASDGLLLNAGQVAGSLGALGVTWLLASDEGADELLYTGAAAAGSALGLAVTYVTLGAGSPDAAEGTDRASASGRDGIQVQLSPTALLTGMLSPSRTPSRRPPPAAPLVTVRF